MTLHRIEHAVVMDTDDIPGRGGYAVVGMSEGVFQPERVFVAQNFGISDFLHDPQNQRTFYSFFPVPGGRHALVRRFANGRRRNQTQNRLFVHTLFIDDELFDALRGIPWLLIQAKVHAVGDGSWDVLKDELPWLVIDAPLPALEADIDAEVVGGLSQRLNTRLDLIGRQLSPSSPDAVATLLTSLARDGRVVLPQGAVYEHLTMLAWSMLPYPDRREMGWTQHDTQRVSGVVFHLANMPEGTMQPEIPDPTVKRIVAMNTASDDEQRELNERTAKYGLSIRHVDALQSWFAWRDALLHVKEKIHRQDEVLGYLTKLAQTARRRHDDPWIDGEEVLQILWQNVSDAVKPPDIAADERVDAVERWAGLLRDSGLHAIIFRQPPDARWLARAADEVGVDLLVHFFILGTGAEAAASAVRTVIGRWLLDVRSDGIEADTLAALALHLALDRSEAAAEILELLLASDAGVMAARKLTSMDKELATFAFDAAEIAVRRGHEHAPHFLAEVLVPHLELSPRLAARITPDFAEDVAALLHDRPAAFRRFAAHLTPEIVATLHATIAVWMSENQKRHAALASAILPLVVAGPGGVAAAAPLAFALAAADEPATAWFGVLLELAASIDTRPDRKSVLDFEESVARLKKHLKKVRLEGALDLLVRLLQGAAASGLRVGHCVRALILLLRPVWGTDPKGLILSVGALVTQTKLATGWEPIVNAIVADFGKTKFRSAVSALVVEYWLTVDPLQVPHADAAILDAISIVDDAGRRRLGEEWQTRVSRLPESRASDRLLALLYPERETNALEVRIAFDRREIAQGRGTHATLNRLDVALSGLSEGLYRDEISADIADFVRQRDPVRRVLALCDLLDAEGVAQTVKGIIETDLLPQTFRRLKGAQWQELTAALQPARLFSRGVATMFFGYGLGARGPIKAQRTFESVCRASRRADGLRAVGKGRSRRGALQWILRLVAGDRPLVAQR